MQHVRNVLDFFQVGSLHARAQCYIMLVPTLEAQ
jgi:hypothetical protein